MPVAPEIDDPELQNVEWEHAAEDSQVLLWQVQIAEQSVEHVPIKEGVFGKIATPEGPEAEGQQHKKVNFDITFKPRKDKYMVITKIASGGPAANARAMMEGDMLIAVNGTPVRGLPRAQILGLIATAPLQLTLGAEFKTGGKYVSVHTIYNGDKVLVKRLAGLCRSSEPSEGLVTPRSRENNSDTVALTPRSSVHANLPPSVDFTQIDYASLRTPQATPQGTPQGTPREGSSPSFPICANPEDATLPNPAAGRAGWQPGLVGAGVRTEVVRTVYHPEAPGMPTPQRLQQNKPADVSPPQPTKKGWKLGKLWRKIKGKKKADRENALIGMDGEQQQARASKGGLMGGMARKLGMTPSKGAPEVFKVSARNENTEQPAVVSPPVFVPEE